MSYVGVKAELLTWDSLADESLAEGERGGNGKLREFIRHFKTTT